MPYLDCGGPRPRVSPVVLPLPVADMLSERYLACTPSMVGGVLRSSFICVPLGFDYFALLSRSFLSSVAHSLVMLSMISKRFRFSFSHLVFYLSSWIIATQIWSAWIQSSLSHGFRPSSHWRFDADVHANVHTLDHEQCDSAFPKLYHSLDKSVSRHRGRKVHIQDIEIAEGRCMLRVMIYQGEVHSHSLP